MKRKAAEEVEEGGEKQSMWNNGKHWVRGELLGQGSFGSVYLATAKKPRSRDLYGGSQYPQIMAVKSAELAAAQSIQHEGNVLFAIKGSPFVIERLGEELTTTEDGKWVYNLLLEYASGGTLYDLIKSYNGCGMPESEVRQHTKSILEGIKHIHNCGYVHCDLKPENILLVPSASGNLVAKVADLGLAKSSYEEPNGWRGTRLYTDPEALIYGMQDQLSDIWSIGCIVLEMLTGNDPWNVNPDVHVEEFMNVVVNERTPKIPEEVSDVARDFLKSCLASIPWERLTAEKLLLHPFVSQPEALQVDDAGRHKQVGSKPRRVSKDKKGLQPQALEVITISDDDDGQFLEPSVIEVITISDDDQKPVVTKRRRVAKDKKGYLAGFQPARAPLTALVAQ